MRRVWSGIAAALALSLAGSAAAKDLSARLDAALRNRALKDARIGVLVVAQQDGRVLYERGPDRALTPASNQKILTAIAVLSAFGPAHRFVTEIYADAPPDAGGGVDVLAIRGSGDPALTSEQYWRLAADLRLLGVRRVRKGLLLDASAFDGERWHPSWGETSARAYHGPVAALSANYSAFSATVKAGSKSGDPVRVLLDPPVAYLRLNNRASTGNRKAATSLVVDRKLVGHGEEVVVSGVVRAASESKTYPRSVLDPVRYAGSVLRAQLGANGIAFGKDGALYVTNIGLSRIVRIPVNPGGKPGNPMTFVEDERLGGPDGITFDSRGNLYSTNGLCGGVFRISPDGEQLAYLAPVNGVLNVWVSPIDDPAAANPVTLDTGRGIRIYFWAYTSKHILYLQDDAGDENWRLYCVDLATRREKALTPASACDFMPSERWS
ncbi:MAG: D-alanyl-D-alanine carboxypeptidase [Myxococcales bacterium]|nr:D-alanyl-D-alanine carboxypeptidase [Myxococcales bacterium]